jgi:hypothetical protein
MFFNTAPIRRLPAVDAGDREISAPTGLRIRPMTIRVQIAFVL